MGAWHQLAPRGLPHSRDSRRQPRLAYEHSAENALSGTFRHKIQTLSGTAPTANSRTNGSDAPTSAVSRTRDRRSRPATSGSHHHMKRRIHAAEGRRQRDGQRRSPGSSTSHATACSSTAATAITSRSDPQSSTSRRQRHHDMSTIAERLPHLHTSQTLATPLPTSTAGTAPNHAPPTPTSPQLAAWITSLCTLCAKRHRSRRPQP
jgi:hypothetical protein